MWQDPIEYLQSTWQMSVDTCENVIEDGVKSGVASIASVAYHLAARDEMVPRFSNENMPPPAKEGTQ